MNESSYGSSGHGGKDSSYGSSKKDDDHSYGSSGHGGKSSGHHGSDEHKGMFLQDIFLKLITCYQVLLTNFGVSTDGLKDKVLHKVGEHISDKFHGK